MTVDDDSDGDLPPVAVVVGGTGEVGEGVVGAFGAAGYEVGVPSRSQANLDRLAERFRGSFSLWPVLADLATDRGVALVREALPAAPRLVVVCLPAPGPSGPLVALTPEALEQALAGTVGLQHRVARGFAPLAASVGGAYVLLDRSPAGSQAVPGSGPASVALAVGHALREILTVELPSLHVVQLVVGSSGRGRSSAARLTPDEIGQLVLSVAGDPATRGRAVRVERRPDGEPEAFLLERTWSPFPLRETVRQI